MTRLGDHPTYSRVVARGQAYSTRPYTLGAVVHDQYHEAAYRLRLAEEDSGVIDEGEPSPGNPLPAGPESSWVLTVGGRRWDPGDFPRGKVARYIERGDEEAGVVRAVLVALDALADYEPQGERLREVVMLCCVSDEARVDRRYGWRHGGAGYARAEVMLGTTRSLQNWLAEAWELVGALAVEPEVLAAAERAGAVSERAAAWVRARG